MPVCLWLACLSPKLTDLNQDPGDVKRIASRHDRRGSLTWGDCGHPDNQLSLRERKSSLLTTYWSEST